MKLDLAPLTLAVERMAQIGIEPLNVAAGECAARWPLRGMPATMWRLHLAWSDLHCIADGRSGQRDGATVSVEMDGVIYFSIDPDRVQP